MLSESEDPEAVQDAFFDDPRSWMAKYTSRKWKKMNMAVTPSLEICTCVMECLVGHPTDADYDHAYELVREELAY